MPLFYFDIDEGPEHASDPLGVELADLRSARIEATLLAGEMLRDRPDAFWGVQSWTMTVTDPDGLTLFSIHVDAVAAPAILLQLRQG
jgi:hypothetical protein